jgi:hypothetical protein
MIQLSDLLTLAIEPEPATIRRAHGVLRNWVTFVKHATELCERVGGALARRGATGL